MCGIVGVHNYGTHTPVNNFAINKLMEEALWVDQIRGSDGTGIMTLTKANRLEYLKVGGSFFALTNEKTFPNIKNWVDTNLFTVGHNRAATRGTRNDKNAHPFIEDHIGLVHNGTLTWFSDKYKDHDWDHNVDSKALAKIISDVGLIKGVDFFRGAYALAWIDTNEKSLNLARNDDRPLGFVKLKDYMLFASEPNMMAWLATRNNFEVLEIGQFEPKKLYTFKAGEKEPTVTNVPEGNHKVFTTPIHSMNNTKFGSGWGTTKNKRRLRQVKHLGMGGDEIISIGDTVSFTIKELKAITQGAFTAFIGELVNPETKETHCVYGNVSMPYSELKKDVDADPDYVVYMGVVSNLADSKTQDLYISVRDVTRVVTGSNLFEPDDKQLPLLEHVKTTVDTTKAPATVPKIVLMEEYRKKEVGQSADTFRCDICEEMYPVANRRSWTRKEFKDGSKQATNYKIIMCDDCLTTSLTDDSKIQALIDIFNKHKVESLS